MLDHAKLLEKLQNVSHKLFTDFSDERDLAKKIWLQICADPLFVHKLSSISTPWMVPSWVGNLNDSYLINPQNSSYCVLGVDGSQIYPDRHQGIGCYLINIGSVQIIYGSCHNPVIFNSTPYVFTGDDDCGLNDNLQEIVNCRRQEFEFEAGINQALKIKQNLVAPSIFLFDGSLIFWHLESKDRAVKDLFLKSYLDQLNQLYKYKILHAGYISLSKGKELVNLIRIALCDFELEGCTNYKKVDHIVDTIVASFFLQPYYRSTLFKSSSPITRFYPVEVQPYFFYLHVGEEIARIEIPYWIACNESLVDQIAAMILDQCKKGNGYPVALAEAHEQAVVKGADREFFYQLICKVGMKHAYKSMLSQKSRKKRGMGI